MTCAYETQTQIGHRAYDNVLYNVKFHVNFVEPAFSQEDKAFCLMKGNACVRISSVLSFTYSCVKFGLLSCGNSKPFSIHV